MNHLAIYGLFGNRHVSYGAEVKVITNQTHIMAVTSKSTASGSTTLVVDIFSTLSNYFNLFFYFFFSLVDVAPTSHYNLSSSLLIL